MDEERYGDMLPAVAGLLTASATVFGKDEDGEADGEDDDARDTGALCTVMSRPAWCRWRFV